MNGGPVSPDDPDSIHLLLVEDDHDTRVLLERVFANNPDFATAVDTVSTLAEAKRLVEGDDPPDAVLLDLGLPDSNGLRTARSMLEVTPDRVAVVVLTAQRDAQLASRALALGAQDYVVKDDLSPQLCTRVVRYGVTRARLIADLDEAREGQRRERELRRLERLAGEGSTTGVSARMLGSGTLRERAPVQSKELEAEYRRILQESLDEQAYRTEERVETDLRSLAQVLGFLGAGPRDVIELHSGVLRELVGHLDPIRATAVIEEARVVVLRLMGRLVTHYRDRSLGDTAAPRRRPSGEVPSSGGSASGSSPQGSES